MISALSMIFLGGGVFFFVAGTVGLLRFPDFYCRLHALTKADNLGMGLLVIGLTLQPTPWPARFQLVMTWLLVLVAAATVCHLLARSALQQGIEPIRGDGEEPR
jgi:multicomponent Na+:H+ antiporter subunit G